jgi:hypothetical protein
LVTSSGRSSGGVNRIKLTVPPVESFAKNVSCIVSFPKPLQQRAIYVFSDRNHLCFLPDFASEGMAKCHQDRDVNLIERMVVEPIFLENVVAFALDELTENFVFLAHFPAREGRSGSSLNLGILSIDLVQDVTYGAGERHGGCPMDPPPLKILFVLQDLEGEPTISENLSGCVGHLLYRRLSGGDVQPKISGMAAP